MQHQYIERKSKKIINERLLGDRFVRILYHQVRENSSALFNILTSARMSQFLATLQFDRPVANQAAFLEACGIDLSECSDPPEFFTTARALFERRIRYWECRPMDISPSSIVSPADSRVIPGSFARDSLIHIKDKFFSYEELLGEGPHNWLPSFQNGDFMVFRLTPDKYHYNHTPVAGTVVDIYHIDGSHHACNPSAVVSIATPFSKNRRVVTIIDTDVPEGTHIGLVAMIEVVALMIGDVTQAYSENRYDNPQSLCVGMFLKKGQPKSLYRPGSSTDILIFQQGRVIFDKDLCENVRLHTVQSRFSSGFGQPLVETDIQVRTRIAVAATEVSHA